MAFRHSFFRCSVPTLAQDARDVRVRRGLAFFTHFAVNGARHIGVPALLATVTGDRTFLFGKCSRSTTRAINVAGMRRIITGIAVFASFGSFFVGVFARRTSRAVDIAHSFVGSSCWAIRTIQSTQSIRKGASDTCFAGFKTTFVRVRPQRTRNLTVAKGFLGRVAQRSQHARGCARDFGKLTLGTQQTFRRTSFIGVSATHTGGAQQSRGPYGITGTAR